MTARRVAWAIWGLTLVLIVAWPFLSEAAKVPDVPKDAKARATYEAFPPSHKREYVEWITEAKQPETRARRLATTLEWLAQGKSRNWKYENC